MLPHGFKVTFILKLADIESATTKRDHYVFVGVDVLGDPRGLYAQTDSRGRLSLQFGYEYSKIGGVPINNMDTPPILIL